MARIVGVDIPRNKKIVFSLCYIHGIGSSTAVRICELAKVDKEKRVQDIESSYSLPYAYPQRLATAYFCLESSRVGRRLRMIPKRGFNSSARSQPNRRLISNTLRPGFLGNPSLLY